MFTTSDKPDVPGVLPPHSAGSAGSCRECASPVPSHTHTQHTNSSLTFFQLKLPGYRATTGTPGKPSPRRSATRRPPSIARTTLPASRPATPHNRAYALSRSDTPAPPSAAGDAANPKRKETG